MHQKQWEASGDRTCIKATGTTDLVGSRFCALIDFETPHVYQPAMLRALFTHAGQASVREIAKALLSEDQSQIEYH